MTETLERSAMFAAVSNPPVVLKTDWVGLRMSASSVVSSVVVADPPNTW